MSKTVSPYGSWASPITLDLVTAKSITFARELHQDPVTGAIFWAELHSADDGRMCVYSYQDGADPPINQWTRAPFNVKTRVHEYGGGSFLAHNGVLYFSNYEDQKLYQQKGPTATPELIIDEEGDIRYADGYYSEKHQSIYIVCEDHTAKKKDNEPENYIAVINPETKQKNILVRGADFYSCPRISSDGKKICWVQWDFPNMPWDDTEIWIAELDKTGNAIQPESKTKIAGGENISAILPYWTLDGRLMYISDQTNWWNVYLVEEGGTHKNINPMSAEIAGPQWQFGQNAYQEDPSGSKTVVTTYNGVLELIDLSTLQCVNIETGFSVHSPSIVYSTNGMIYNLAGAPGKSITLIQINPKNKEVKVIKEPTSFQIDPEYISIPQNISYKTRDGDTAYGNLYLPQNAKFASSSDTLPPLLVRSHGGPTGQATTSLNLEIQYFTSRGFALLDVDYRGSTGYGREYRNKLRKNWGIFDVEDCCSGAIHLVKRKLVDPNKLCTDGQSAGGYTTLATLVFHKVFNAGVSFYGVSDLGGLAQDTHKFESRYLDLLIGKYPEEKELYYKRSPINFVDSICAPLALFQGGKDMVVPPNQAEMMYDAVKEKKLPTAYVLFPEERHGFLETKNRKVALGGEFYFFSKVFKFTPSDEDEIIKIDIVNS